MGTLHYVVSMLKTLQLKRNIFSHHFIFLGIYTVKYLIDGNAIKNLERIFSRELCILYNMDGICGKNSLKGYKNIYKIVIGKYSDFKRLFSLNNYLHFSCNM